MERQAPRLIQGVVLRHLKYNDRYNILWLYTRESGRVSVLLPLGGRRNASSLRAVTQPLSKIELVARWGRGGLLHGAELRPTAVLYSLQSDPSKMVMAMFIAEFLSITLTEGEADERLFRFVSSTVDLLEGYSHSTANFHLAFLFGLTVPLGIAPDLSTYAPGRIFDMVDATYRDSVPLNTQHWLTAEQGATLALLSRMTMENSYSFEFSRSQRNDVLDLLLRYYALHYRALNSMQALSVLRRFYD